MKVEEKYKEVKLLVKDAELYQKLRSLDKNEEAKEMLKDKDAQYITKMKDIKKIREIKARLPKVANVLEVKAQLISQIDVIKKQIIEIDRLENEIENSLKEIENEENSLKEKQKKWAELDKKIAKAKNPEERAKFLEEQEQFKKDFAKNDKKVEERKEIIDEKRNVLNKKIATKSKEQLAKMSFELGRKISMCNVAARGLMEGKDIGDIDLDKNISGKKFDANEEIKRILKFSREKDKEVKGKEVQEQEIEDLSAKIMMQTEKQFGLKEHKQGEKEKSLIEVYDFAKKHPKLARIPGLAKFVNSIKNRYISSKEQNLEKSVVEQEKVKNVDKKQEVSKKMYIPRQENEFKKFLKESAEKGMKEAGANARKNSDAYARLQANKAKAIQEQDIKDGIGINNMRLNGSKIKDKYQSYSERSGDAR